MRELKFRYVFKRHSDAETYMLTARVQGLEASSEGDLKNMLYTNPKWELVDRQQFTTLLDVNGNEIYEGDIIKKGEHYFEVCWNPLSIGLKLKHNGRWAGEIRMMFPSMQECHIAGNIHETPELLNE